MPHPKPAAPPKRPFRKSPNRQRAVGRTVLWTFALGAAAAWLPHLMR